jgi:restriction system protein
VILFSRGAGVHGQVIDHLAEQVRQDRDGIYKREIAQQLLVLVNEGGDATLRQRREIVKRVVEWEDFSTCWDDKRLAAQGLVAQVRKRVNEHDAFTRLHQAQETERTERLAPGRAKLEELQRLRERYAKLKKDFAALFTLANPQQRGKRSEEEFNELFALGDILVRQAFTLLGEVGEGIIEQIDGLVDIDGRLFLVEMKWWKTPGGRPEASEHLVRLYGRPEAHGIFISASGYTDAAVAVCKEALLQSRVVVLCDLREIALLIEQEADIREFLRQKIQAAIVDRNPSYSPPLAVFYRVG